MSRQLTVVPLRVYLASKLVVSCSLMLLMITDPSTIGRYNNSRASLIQVTVSSFEESLNSPEFLRALLFTSIPASTHANFA